MRCYLLVTSWPALAVAFVAFLGTGIFVAADESTSGKTVVNATVYYESLCADSVRFIRDQLAPTYKKLKDHLSVTFVPYGKATHHREDASSPWQFTCQHGAAECQGNKGQSCALDAIQKYEALENRQGFSVDFVVCAMTVSDRPSAVSQCTRTVGLSSETQNAITQCTQSSTADDLLASHGARTDALEPQLSFVPTIVINGVYSSENQSAALRNFKKLICQQLPENEQPNVCAE